MSGYPLFIPEFVLCTNSSLFWYKIANELREFRNYLLFLNLLLHLVLCFQDKMIQVPFGKFFTSLWHKRASSDGNFLFCESNPKSCTGNCF